MSEPTKTRRTRSPVDGKLRVKCQECGRMLATDEDWLDETIGEGQRDDLCWGTGANCELPTS